MRPEGGALVGKATPTEAERSDQLTTRRDSAAGLINGVGRHADHEPARSLGAQSFSSP
jgi:hypothetical protein